MPFDQWDGHMEALHERLEYYRRHPGTIGAEMLVETVADFLAEVMEDEDLRTGYAGDENEGEPDTTTR